MTATTIDLKRARLFAGRRPQEHPLGQAQIAISQAELASRLGVDQSQVSRYEDRPELVPHPLLLQWLDALGMTMAQALALSNGESTPPLDVGAPYASAHRNVATMRSYAAEAAAGEEGGVPRGVERQVYEEFVALLDRIGRKPNLVFTGPFDAAKSTLANELLGGRYLPTSYQPATRVRTFVRHFSDRPAWMQEEVWVMKRGFDPLRWNDQRHCEQHRLVAGNLTTLADYGTHRGSREREAREQQAIAAVVYLDAPILRACNLVDLPGFDAGADDDEVALADGFPTDVAIYVSPANGFLRATDLLQLGELLRRIPAIEASGARLAPLGNLFVVATHASPSISDGDLEDIHAGGARRAFSQLEEFFGARDADGTATSEETIRARMFAFWRESPDRWLPLREDLRQLLGVALPRLWESIARSELDSFRNRADAEAARFVETYRRLYEELEGAERELKAALAREPARRERARDSRVRLLKSITGRRTAHRDSARVAYEELATPEAIERLILQQGWDKRHAREYAAGFVLERLRGRVERRGAELSREFGGEVEQFLGTYELGELRLDPDRPSVEVPFNAQGAFVGGLSGTVAVGALAVWAASLGNLGAYIIAAKVASLLSAVGITITGGAAALTSALAAIGGPVTLAVGLVAAAVLIGMAIFGPSWQVRLSRKISGMLQERNVLGQYLKAIDGYWEATATAFAGAADAVESAWNDHLDNLRRLLDVRSKSREEIESRIKDAEAAREFFHGIGWERRAIEDTAAVQ